MKEIRRYYSGEQLSATKLNDLVDALRCLCSEAKKLQKIRFTYGSQPINAERRYWASDAGCNACASCVDWGPECVCVKERCIGTCRAAFELVRWGTTEYTYVTPGAMWNGLELDQQSWSLVCNTCKPLYIKEGGYHTRAEGYDEFYSGETNRIVTSWGIRGGVLMMKDSQATHRGGGSYTRGDYVGLGAVSISNTGGFTISRLPYHLMSGGVDSWSGGMLEDNVEIEQEYSFCNSLRIERNTIASDKPAWRCVCGEGGMGMVRNNVQSYPIFFVRATNEGLNELTGACQNVWLIMDDSTSGMIPCYVQSGVRFWFCMSASSTYLRESGYVQIKWSGDTGRCNDKLWESMVPVAHAFRNVYAGYVECYRILEEEVLVQPTVYITAPGGSVILDAAGVQPMRPLGGNEGVPEKECYGGVRAVSCVRCALWVGLPKTISKQRFFPWGNVCSGFYTWCGCSGEE